MNNVLRNLISPLRHIPCSGFHSDYRSGGEYRKDVYRNDSGTEINADRLSAGNSSNYKEASHVSGISTQAFYH
jgi:hypothetical protein